MGAPWSEGGGTVCRLNILLVLDLVTLLVFLCLVEQMPSQEWRYNFVLKKSEEQNPGLNEVCSDISFSVFVLFVHVSKFRPLLH